MTCWHVSHLKCQGRIEFSIVQYFGLSLFLKFLFFIKLIPFSSLHAIFSLLYFLIPFMSLQSSLEVFPLIRLYHNSISIIGSEQFNMLLISYFFVRNEMKNFWKVNWRESNKGRMRGYLACKLFLFLFIIIIVVCCRSVMIKIRLNFLHIMRYCSL